jgi:hypothetical protein
VFLGVGWLGRFDGWFKNSMLGPVLIHDGETVVNEDRQKRVPLLRFGMESKRAGNGKSESTAGLEGLVGWVGEGGVGGGAGPVNAEVGDAA